MDHNVRIACLQEEFTSASREVPILKRGVTDGNHCSRCACSLYFYLNV